MPKPPKQPVRTSNPKPVEEKRLKAWGILLDGELAHYVALNQYVFARTKKEAMFGLRDEGYKVVPVLITYRPNQKK